jgi:hypothetical protein
VNTPHAIWHDPIVAEIHAIRERIASQFHNDLAAYSKAAEEHCRSLGFTVTTDSSARQDADDTAAPPSHT